MFKQSLILLFLILNGAAAMASPKLAKIPAGEFTPFWILPQGKDGTVEKVRIDSFEVMTYPVTNREFRAFVKQSPEWNKQNVKRIFADENYLSQTGKNDSPVGHVSWFSARAYCESKGMRLPTTNEWEYIAAASETKADASRDPEFLNRILEWYSETRPEEGLPRVGRKQPNIYGVHDLHGLTWEWVEDFNSNLVTGESRNGGALNRDLFCGSGAMAGGNKENYAAYMRFAFRSSLKGASTAWNLSFRCVKGV